VRGEGLGVGLADTLSARSCDSHRALSSAEEEAAEVPPCAATAAAPRCSKMPLTCLVRAGLGLGWGEG
jgi:hypothetical protein